MHSPIKFLNNCLVQKHFGGELANVRYSKRGRRGKGRTGSERAARKSRKQRVQTVVNRVITYSRIFDLAECEGNFIRLWSGEWLATSTVDIITRLIKHYNCKSAMRFVTSVCGIAVSLADVSVPLSDCFPNRVVIWREGDQTCCGHIPRHVQIDLLNLTDRGNQAERIQLVFEASCLDSKNVDGELIGVFRQDVSWTLYKRLPKV